jgi:hypothetical protein
MTSRILLVVLTACLLAVPSVAPAQTNSGDVTFTVPINLTQLQPDVVKVRVRCFLSSDAITVNRQPTGKGGTGPLGPGEVLGVQELPVSGGRVVTTATVVVVVGGNLENPLGKLARYSCQLQGFSNTAQVWNIFDGYPNSAFVLTPQPSLIAGTFTW